MQEHYLPVTIKPFDRFYSVSNLGNVKRTRTFAGAKKDSVLLPSTSNAGYRRVALCANGKIRCFTVHLLVCLAFCGPKPSPKHNPNHKNGRKNDNSATNLEWLTYSENTLHSYYVLGNKALSGATHPHYGKFGAAAVSSKAYIVTSPEGKELKILGLSAFCREQGLFMPTMNNLANNNRCKQHRGWKCRHAKEDL